MPSPDFSASSSSLSCRRSGRERKPTVKVRDNQKISEQREIIRTTLAVRKRKRTAEPVQDSMAPRGKKPRKNAPKKPAVSTAATKPFDIVVLPGSTRPQAHDESSYANCRHVYEHVWRLPFHNQNEANTTYNAQSSRTSMPAPTHGATMPASTYRTVVTAPMPTPPADGRYPYFPRNPYGSGPSGSHIWQKLKHSTGRQPLYKRRNADLWVPVHKIHLWSDCSLISPPIPTISADWESVKPDDDTDELHAPPHMPTGIAHKCLIPLRPSSLYVDQTQYLMVSRDGSQARLTKEAIDLSLSRLALTFDSYHATMAHYTFQFQVSWLRQMRGPTMQCLLRRDKYVQSMLRWPETMAMDGVGAGYPGVQLNTGEKWLGTEGRAQHSGPNTAWTVKQGAETQMQLFRTAVSYQAFLLHINWTTTMEHGYSILTNEEKENLGSMVEQVFAWAQQDRSYKEVLQHLPFGGLDMVVGNDEGDEEETET